MNHERRTLIVYAAAILTAVQACAPDQSIQLDEPEHGESILDSISRVEPELFTSFPETFRWCDRIEGLEKRRIDVGGAELYVGTEGRGEPLVLINGGPGGTHHYFHPWFSRARGFAQVVYYDQRGCGLSDYEPGDEGYSVEQAVEDLEAIRTALGFERWTVLGYSYGGFLAQLYTVLHPERVSGLVLLGASPGFRADIGPSRQSEFITNEERARLEEARGQVAEYAEANGLSQQERMNLFIYNNFLNGDWKRQSFYRPGPDRMVQAALYEWVHDENFNGILGESQARWDLAGAFEGSPIPTLILEGRWDLTWGEGKREALVGNHPNGRMVVFEDAAHGIYDEQPDEFFRVLGEFLEERPDVDEAQLTAYEASAEEWVAAVRARQEEAAPYTDWGLEASRALADRYSQEWVDSLEDLGQLLRGGFALYDVERYEDALVVFRAMEERLGDEDDVRALSLIWQGHMLDLLGRRAEALVVYQEAADLDVTDGWSHGQYGMRYELSPYARERLDTPFVRIENRSFE